MELDQWDVQEKRKSKKENAIYYYFSVIIT